MEKINLEKLKVQFKGKPFYQLIEYHLSRTKNTKKLKEASVGTAAMLPQAAQSLVVGFIDKWNEKVNDESFWQKDTSDVFSEITDDARSLLSSFIQPIDDETLFNMFQVVVLSYAYSASDQPAMQGFIRAGKVGSHLIATRSLDKKVFKRGLIVTLILMVIWSIVLEFIPEGWWVLAINIVGILITAWILLSTTIPFLRIYLHTIIAVISSGVIWFVMIVITRLIIGAIVGAAILSPTTGLDQGTEQSEDFSKTLPVTSTPATEPAIPSHYTTYADEANIFSISYPPEWEVNLSLIDDVKFQEYMKQSLESGTPESVVEDIPYIIVFLAGIPTGKGGYSPNVNIAIVPSFGEEPNLDDLIDEKIKASKELFAEYTSFLRIPTTVDGTDAVITESESYLSGRERSCHLTMHMLKYNVIWIVTCTSSATEFTNYEDDFYHVVRSLRILK